MNDMDIIEKISQAREKINFAYNETLDLTKPDFMVSGALQISETSLIEATAEIESLRAKNQKLQNHIEKMRLVKGTPHD